MRKSSGNSSYIDEKNKTNGGKSIKTCFLNGITEEILEEKLKRFKSVYIG